MPGWNTLTVNNKHPLLSIRDLTVEFGEGDEKFCAVSRLDLDVYPGEIVGLIGESGSGKTTTAHSLLGLVDGAPGIVSGRAWLSGTPLFPSVEAYSRKRGDSTTKNVPAFLKQQRRMLNGILGRDVGAIFQEPKSALHPFYDVGWHLIDCIGRAAHPPKDALRWGRDMLAKVGLAESDNIWGYFPHQLSGGMAQRVMIAMALCSRPRLLLADEPTTALDVTTQAKLLELFARLQAQEGLGILLISHDIGVVREIADRIYVMREGVLVENGDCTRVLDQPAHAYTQMLLSAFKMFAAGDRA